MNRQQIEEQIKDIIQFHYGWDLWASRAQESFEAGVKPFVNSLAELVEQVAGSKELTDYKLGAADDIRSQLNIEIWGKVRELRRKRGISLARMADLVGVDPEYYADLEQGAAWARTIDLRDTLAVLKVRSSEVLPF